MKQDRSRILFEEARRLMPGGVNSPVRAFGAVGGTPVFIDHAEGASLVDVDGNTFIDFVGSWGPMILGHAHPDVTAAITEAVEGGTSFGAPGEMENRLARLIIDRVPSLEMVRMVNSGTEATMSAIRLARGYTGRDKIIKFEGCYHGHGDSFLIKAGSGALTLGVPSSAGVPVAVAGETLLARFNDLESVQALFRAQGEEVAALIIEPVAGNMGCIPAKTAFLEGLRELCTQHGALLVFDEVMTGFRVHPQGAQGLFGSTPDLSTFGKIIGGGLPVGAYGGRREIMEQVAPMGPVYQAGTLSGNPLAMAAGCATLALCNEDLYTQLERLGQRLADGVQAIITASSAELSMNRVGSMFTLFFTGSDVNGYADVLGCDTDRFGRFFHHALENGIYLPPSQFETAFLSAAHTKDHIDQLLAVLADFLKGQS